MQTPVPDHESTRIPEFASPKSMPPKSMPRLTPNHPISGGSTRQLPVLSPHLPDLQPGTLHVSPIQPRGQLNFEDSSDNIAVNIPYQAVEPVEEASIDDLTVENINIADEQQEVEYSMLFVYMLRVETGKLLCLVYKISRHKTGQDALKALNMVKFISIQPLENDRCLMTVMYHLLSGAYNGGLH